MRRMGRRWYDSPVWGDTDVVEDIERQKLINLRLRDQHDRVFKKEWLNQAESKPRSGGSEPSKGPDASYTTHDNRASFDLSNVRLEIQGALTYLREAQRVHPLWSQDHAVAILERLLKGLR